jgi:hypothetical protein
MKVIDNQATEAKYLATKQSTTIQQITLSIEEKENINILHPTRPIWVPLGRI